MRMKLSRYHKKESNREALRQFTSSSSVSVMSISSIQGQLLEVTVVGCTKLKNTEWISRQDPYVCLEYSSSKFRTNTCKDGGTNPAFQEKFVFALVEGLREINVFVWNSNSITSNDFIGGGTIQLQKVLSHGFDDSGWPIQTKSGRHAGEVRVILHYGNANKPASNFPSSAPPYLFPPYPPSLQPAAAYAPYPFPTIGFYPPPNMPHPYSSSYYPYPSNPIEYPPRTYPPPHFAFYPPSSYAPPPSYPSPVNPPPPHGFSYHPAGVFPGLYQPPK